MFYSHNIYIKLKKDFRKSATEVKDKLWLILQNINCLWVVWRRFLRPALHFS